MSERLTFKTQIAATANTPEAVRAAGERLKRTCDRLRREAGWNTLRGPNWENSYPMRRTGTRAEGYMVKLPGWLGEAFFACDQQGTMEADNYSPYFDNRATDPVSGERISGTGTVHADVLAGRKRVGEDGRWGDIKYLDRLGQEYVVQGFLDAAEARMDQINSLTYNQDGSIELELEVVTV